LVLLGFFCGPVHDKPFLDLIYGPKKKKGLIFGQLFFGVGVGGWFLYYKVGTM